MDELLTLNVLILAISLYVVLLALYNLYRVLSSPLRRIPGPFLARFSDFWYFSRVNRGQFEKDNLALHQKHGPIIRYGPNRYSFNHMDAVHAIYSVSAARRFPKSPWYQAFAPPTKDEPELFSDQNIQRHSQRRRKYQSLYSLSSMISYEGFVTECVDLFDQRLQEMATDQGQQSNGYLVDMGHWFQCYAFDVIGMITYSKRMGFLDAGLDIGNVMSDIESGFRIVSLAGIYPIIQNTATAVYKWLRLKPKTGFNFVIAFTQQLIDEHRTQPKAVTLDDEKSEETVDFLSKMLSRHRQDPVTYNEWYSLIGAAQNMGAGSDTTSISLSAILYYLLKNPQAMTKLRQEVDEHQRTSKSRDITFQDSQAMPYLQAVIKETLRLHPATGLPLERVVPEGGATICGQFFPAGTIVGVNTWVEHRNEQIFGHDAAEFRPERWLVNDADKVAFMNRHWMPFGLGARTCIGRHVSYLEMSKLVPRLVRDFDFEFPKEFSSTRAWKTENYWFVKPKDFKVNVRIRTLKEG